MFKIAFFSVFIASMASFSTAGTIRFEYQSPELSLSGFNGTDEEAQELEDAGFTPPETFPSVGFAFTIRGEDFPAPVTVGSEVSIDPPSFLAVDGVSNRIDDFGNFAEFDLVDVRSSTLYVSGNSIFRFNVVVGPEERATDWGIQIANEADIDFGSSSSGGSYLGLTARDLGCRTPTCLDLSNNSPRLAKFIYRANDPGTFTVRPVPLPATGLLLLTGLGVLAVRRRREMR